MMLSLAISPGNPALRSDRPELFTNGTFDSDVAGWFTGSGGSLTWVSGKARVTNGAAAAGYFAQTITTYIGQVVTVRMTASNLVGTSATRISANAGASAAYVGSLGATNYTGAGTFERTFTATSTQTTVAFFVNSTTLGHSADFDDLSAR